MLVAEFLGSIIVYIRVSYHIVKDWIHGWPSDSRSGYRISAGDDLVCPGINYSGRRLHLYVCVMILECRRVIYTVCVYKTFVCAAVYSLIREFMGWISF